MTNISQAAALSSSSNPVVNLFTSTNEVEQHLLDVPMGPSVYDQLLHEGRDRLEQDYIEHLKAAGKPIYTIVDLNKRFGLNYTGNLNQAQLQERMAVGDIYYPAISLKKKAAEIEKLYVSKGRAALKALAADIYALYVKAMQSENKEMIFKFMRGKLEEKARENTPDSSVLVRYIHEAFDDKQVHMLGRAFEYCFFVNVPADGYIAKVDETTGGLEGLRKLAQEHLPKSQKQLKAQAERDSKKAEQASVIDNIWKVRRAHPICSLSVPADAGLELSAGVAYELVAEVVDGKLNVVRAVRMGQKEKELADARTVARAKLAVEAGNSILSDEKDPYSYMNAIIREHEQGPNHPAFKLYLNALRAL